MKCLTVALIGAGLRGQSYTNFMKDDRFKVVAVAEREDIDLPLEEHLIVELYSK